VEDNGGLTFEKILSITVLDVNDDPTDLSLSTTEIPSDQEDGTEIGTFSADDEDQDDVTFSLITGEGDADNTSFSISGQSLITSGLTLDDVDAQFSILVEGADGRGGFVVQPFTLTVKEILGLMNLAAHGIVIFPNPVSDRLGIKLDNSYQGEVLLTISNLEGKDVYLSRWEKSGTAFKSNFDLSHLASGVYLMKLTMGNKRAQGRLIKE
jgi:hypothetical protein